MKWIIKSLVNIINVQRDPTCWSIFSTIHISIKLKKEQEETCKSI